MAKKDFDKYFENYTTYFLSMIDMTNVMTEELKTKLIEPERLENFKKTADPVIHTYKLLQEVKRLLDRPVRKIKQPGFDKRTKRLAALTSENNLDAINEQAEQAINNLKDMVE